MPQNKYVAKDCILRLMTILNDSNWLTYQDPSTLNWASGDVANYYVRNVTIEATTETIDLTGVMQGIVNYGDGKFDGRVTMTKLIPLAHIGGGARVNAKAVPKDASVTLTYYSASSFRGNVNQQAAQIASAQGIARSIEYTFTVNNTRVDGFGDTYMYRRPISIDGRCRIEGLLVTKSSAADNNYNFLYHELHPLAQNRIVNVSTLLPTFEANKYYAVYFTGGVSRVGLNIDNPLRQDLELVSIGFLPETAYTNTLTYVDPTFALFQIVSNNYASLKFAFELTIPKVSGTVSNTVIYGMMGLEELTFTFNDGEITNSVTGVIYGGDFVITA